MDFGQQRVFFTVLINLLLIYQTAHCEYDYDLVVIGAGASGLVAALAAAEHKGRVAIIEREDKIGGSHTWTGDIPSKTLISLANMSQEIIVANKCGLCDTRNVNVNSLYVLPYIRSVCQKVYDIHSPDFFICSEIKVIHGSAQFIDSHTISINATEHITSEKFIIATGSTPKIPPIKGIDTIDYLTPDTFFNGESLPDSLIIIGAGPLGTELAAALNRLGVKVTLIMKYGVILPTFDYELVEQLMALLSGEGLTIRCNVEAIEVASLSDGALMLTCCNKNGSYETYYADALFLATNRRARTNDLNLEAAGVQISARGIIVNEEMQTTAPNIFACGDVVGQYILSRVAYYQARVAVHNATRAWWQRSKKTSYTDVAKVAFTQPMIASTGLTEQEARKKHGNALVIHRISYNYLSKALIDNKTTGLAKFIYNKSGVLLGAHILGEQAGLLIDQLCVGKRLDTHLGTFASQVYTSPSYLDLLWLALEKYHTDFAPVTPLCAVCNTVTDWLSA